jgi:hypothetical protein
MPQSPVAIKVIFSIFNSFSFDFYFKIEKKNKRIKKTRKTRNKTLSTE